jgi:copper chaperone CopZ
MFGAAAMSCSSLFVVSNALRLRHFGRKKAQEAQKSQKIEEKGDKTMVIEIKGMMCMHCVAHVEKALKAVPGVTEVKVDLQAGNATVSGNATAEALTAAITDEGYEVVSVK